MSGISLAWTATGMAGSGTATGESTAATGAGGPGSWLGAGPSSPVSNQMDFGRTAVRTPLTLVLTPLTACPGPEIRPGCPPVPKRRREPTDAAGSTSATVSGTQISAD